MKWLTIVSLAVLALFCVAATGDAQIPIDLNEARASLVGNDGVRIQGIRAEGAYWTATFRWNAETASFDLGDYHPSDPPLPCTKEEACGNGIDDDCDGNVDEGVRGALRRYCGAVVSGRPVLPVSGGHLRVCRHDGRVYSHS